MECCATVPVTTGSPRFRRRNLGALNVVDATFAADDVLAAHAHERIIAGFMAAGGFDLAFSSRNYDCPEGAAFIEPAGERHANRIGRSGARVLVLELDPRLSSDDLRACRSHLTAPSLARRADLVPMMRRLMHCLGDRDQAPVESLAWELLSRSARPTLRPRPTRWAEQVRELLHANLHRPLKLADLARDLGVHRVHLGRVFRDRYGESFGDYHRRIRLEWAAAELDRDDASIGDIGLRAGFADHAHFTRLFKRQTGRTPGQWRYQRSRR